MHSLHAVISTVCGQMSGTVEEVLLQNEDLLFSAAGVRCVIGKVRSARFDRCKVQQLQPEKMLAMCHFILAQMPPVRVSIRPFLRARGPTLKLHVGRWRVW